jgi:fructose 1,6-bisphosphate aldolase/phosphatase
MHEKETAVELTISILKADVGSIGGHTKPSERQLAAARDTIEQARSRIGIIDYTITHTGDDIAITATHTRGTNNEAVHRMAWDAFMAATGEAQRKGLYAAGQDLLVDAPSSNIRGAGPAVAELTYDHNLSGERPAESVIIFAADKCGPGAYNLPLFLAFADPMYCGGLLLKPEMNKGFSFRIMDMDHSASDRVVDLVAPEDLYKIPALLRGETRYAIESIYSRAYPDQQAASISTQRLHNIAGKYTGKDDPVAIVRTQGIFPAPEEIVLPWLMAHYVTGDCRGSHVMPIAPYPVNSSVRGPYCLPIVSAMAISIDKDGTFSDEVIDLFADPSYDETRRIAMQKAMAMRAQGWFGAAMANEEELAYTGIKEVVSGLQGNWFDLSRNGHAPTPAMQPAGD